MLAQFVEGFEDEVGVDGADSVADEDGEVVGFAGLAGLEDEVALGAAAGADEVVVDGGAGEEAGDGGVAGVDAAVGEDEDAGTVIDGLGGGGLEAVEGGLECAFAIGGAEERGEGGAAEGGLVEFLDLGALTVGDDGAGQLELAGVLRRGLEEVSAGTEEGFRGGDEFFPLGVEGGVGDLSEELTEVVEEGLAFVGEDGEGDVVAHGADGFLGGLGHGGDEHGEFFAGEALGLLAVAEGGEVGGGDVFGLGQVVQVAALLAEPLPVGAGGGEAPLDFVVGDDAAFVHVDEEDAAGTDAAALLDAVWGDVQDAGFGAHDDEAVLGDGVAEGAEAVAVEDDGELLAVGGGDHGGAVPGFHEGGVEVVEVAALLGHGLVVFEGLGDHHHEALGEGAAGVEEEFEGVVEGGGVALGGDADGEEVRYFIAEAVGGEDGLAGGHGVDVAAEGVDFAVVADVAVGVGEGPGAEGVGAEAGVDEGEGADEIRIVQVAVEGLELAGDEEALVDDAVGGEGGDVEGVLAGEVRGGDGVFDDATDDVEAAFEGAVGEVGADGGSAFRDEALADDGQDAAGAAADGVRVGGDVAPAEEAEAAGGDGVLKEALAPGTLAGVRGEEAHADAVAAGVGEIDAEAGGLGAEEGVGQVGRGCRRRRR